MTYLDSLLDQSPISKYLHYSHNIRHLFVEPRTSIDFLNLNINDLRILKPIIKNKNNCIICLKKHGVGFLTNINLVKRIPLIDKYINGSGSIPNKYKIYNMFNQRFETFSGKNKSTYGTLLVTIDIELFNIHDEILNLFHFIPNLVNNEGYIYRFHLNSLRYKLDYDIKTIWPEDYILSQIEDFINILGIEIKNYNQNNDLIQDID